MRVDSKVESDPLRRRLRRISASERMEEALGFIRQFHREVAGSRGLEVRLKEVRQSLRRTGTYEHTPEELAFGARVAWRNHARCIGRLHWRSLEVIDRRGTREPDAIATALFEHIRWAQGDGRIRSAITIFDPVSPGDLPPFVESRQLIQYAGHLRPGARVLGDPQTVESTRHAAALGWRPSGGEPSRFDLLPLLIRSAAGQRSAHPLPEGLVREIHLEHATETGLGRLGLRWYALPVVSGMILTIGGLEYPCAPFNGWYMGTEIASRNLADERRYDLLPEVAAALGLEAVDGSLWRDHALTALNEAVLHSFQREGVSIVDHHAASEQYMEFARTEEGHGRTPAGDWTWIVPPQASSACPVFHLDMQPRTEVPNYYWSRAVDGDDLCLWRDHEDHSKWWFRAHRIRHRVRRWLRTKGE
ncbi:MAG: nitric oxide synthase oxygenase [Planctomycetes bacterium]|nr:nitric oxide synthase oxygenase [Planctomycetota bacterium]